MMFFAILTLVTALAMATTAAWFAIAGIIAVFAGAPIPALIMGAVVEAGKVVGVSWIYRHWKEKTSIKFFMLPAVIVAMLLTSMGIFGFLSKAHLEQSAPVGNNQAQIERLDQRITREEGRITDAETVISQLDETVNTLIEYDKISGPDGARSVRDGQQEQRDQLASIIDNAEDTIVKYSDEKFGLSSELRELELEVGPVKYIAELMYSEPENRLEDAVRFVIIAFIFVFDPMAILLLMGANYSIIKARKKPDNIPSEPSESQIFVEPTVIDDETTPGSGLINLIEEITEEVDKTPKEVIKEVQVDSSKITKNNTVDDREWMLDIPKTDKDVPDEVVIQTLNRLQDRDLTKGEKRLLQRFRQLAARRNISPEVARRAQVTTSNNLLKQ